MTISILFTKSVRYKGLIKMQALVRQNAVRTSPIQVLSGLPRTFAIFCGNYVR